MRYRPRQPTGQVEPLKSVQPLVRPPKACPDCNTECELVLVGGKGYKPLWLCFWCSELRVVRRRHGLPDPMRRSRC